MNIEFSVGSGDKARRISRPSAVNILVVGNFQGRPVTDADAATDAAIRNMFSFDPLELDSAMHRIGPATSVEVGEQAISLSFDGMEDFHPDALLKGLPLFSTAMDLRKSLDDPAKSTAAASLVRELLGEPDERPEHAAANVAVTPEAPGPKEEQESSGDLFSRLLGQEAASERSENPIVKSTLDRLLADVIEEDRAPPVDTNAQSLKVGLEDFISTALRELLHHPDYRSLETAWRSLAWLGEHIEFDESATLWLVDTDVTDVATWTQALPRHVAAGPGSASIIVALHEFDDTPDSLEQLKALAAMSSTLGARTFSAASSRVAGLQGRLESPVALDASDFSDAIGPGWKNATSGDGSAQVALGFPALLIRHPYGRRSDPVDAFDFDELGIAPGHDAFAWGNPALALAVMSHQNSLSIEDFPLVSFDDGGGQAIKPPTGAYLTDSAAEKLLDRGIVPLLAERGGTSVRIPRLQSIAITAL